MHMYIHVHGTIPKQCRKEVRNWEVTSLYKKKKNFEVKVFSDCHEHILSKNLQCRLCVCVCVLCVVFVPQLLL